MCIWYSPLAAMRHTYFWKAPGPLCRQVTPAIAEQRKVQSTTTLEIVGKKPTVCSTSKLGETHLQKAKGNAGYTRGPDNPFEKRSGKTGSSWWLNQPIWKMCYLDHVPRDRGENKQWLKPSPRYGFGLGIKELPQEIGTVKLDPLQPRKWTNS